MVYYIESYLFTHGRKNIGARTYIASYSIMYDMLAINNIISNIQRDYHTIDSLQLLVAWGEKSCAW